MGDQRLKPADPSIDATGGRVCVKSPKIVFNNLWLVPKLSFSFQVDEVGEANSAICKFCQTEVDFDREDMSALVNHLQSEHQVCTKVPTRDLCSHM